MKRNHFRRRLLIAILVLLIGATIGINGWVSRSAREQLYADIGQIPHRKVGLLLGTSPQGKNGSVNPYYRHRINAAIALYKAGKVDYLLVSGDNGTREYNEPEAMQADLIAGGVPADRIVLDYAGFRTLDSIVRCKEVFGEDNIVIISQQFHNERALFIARYRGIKAIAFNAEDISMKRGFLVQAREKLARVKMVLDLLVNKGPKFYGDRIEIGPAAVTPALN